MSGAPENPKFKPITVEKGIRQVGPHRWEVRVFAGRNPETGQSRLVTRGTTKGIRDARAIRAKLTTEVAEGKHGVKAGTFGALLDAWLTDGKQDRSPTTVFRYRQKIEAAIRPALGSKMLDELTSKDIDAFYAELRRNGKSPAMVMEYHRIIAAALRQAKKWKLVPASEALDASPPQVPKKAMTVPPPERVRQLIDAASTSRNPDFAIVITVAALTGLRRGELCGLQWRDIDWPGSSLTVHRAYWNNNAKERGTKDPKTHQVRKVELGPDAMEVLRFRWQRVTENATAVGVTLSDDAYIFSTSVDGTQPLLPDTVSHSFRRLCQGMEGDWPYRFHDIRHYTATELIAAGYSPRTVANRLGHSDPALTLRVYVHDTDALAKSAAASLEAGLA